MPTTAPDGRIPVAVGVLGDGNGRYLLASRPANKDYAGWWEFPGGKIDPGEEGIEALRRELHEELGISVGAVLPLTTVRHDYPDRKVTLVVWLVTGYEGRATAREGQQLRWLTPAEIRTVKLLDGGWPIVAALEALAAGSPVAVIDGRG